MENSGNTGKYLKNHPFSYHPRTSTVIILIFPYQKKIKKKEVIVEPYQRSLEIKNRLFKIPKNSVKNNKQKPFKQSEAPAIVEKVKL